MASFSYIKAPLSSQLPQYLDQEFRKIELATSIAGAAADDLQAAIDLLNSPLVWTAVTFQNSWANFGAAFQSVEYARDQRGRVYIRGLMTGGVIGSPAFTLPAGYRPPGIVLSAQCSGTSGGVNVFIRVDIGADGTVTPIASGLATNSFVSINFSFDTN